MFCVFVCFAGNVYADSDFEEVFLRQDKAGASPEVFVWQNAVTPGIKSVDVRVNDHLADHMEVNFVDNGDKRVIPCLSPEQLKSLGIKYELYDDGKTPEEANSALAGCVPVEQKIPSSSMVFDSTLQVLSLIVPQEAVDRQRFTMISPDEWDHGVPSLRTSYNGYFYSAKTKGQSGDGWSTDNTTSRSAYVNLNSVGSLGAWRFYSIDSFYRNPGKSWEANHDRAYLSRDIAFLRSNMQVGEIYTSTSDYMLGAIPMTGVSLTTSQKMSLDNQFNYSPVIRGVARTNARLVVRQHGNIIYSTTLTPGPFAIDDLYSAQVGADLQVTVEESDGQRQTFNVPYTALPNMIRPGASRYSLAAGQYRNQSNGSEEPWVTTGSLEYGLEKFTLSGSSLISQDYQSLSVGAAWNAGSLGSFSTEVAHARHKETWKGGKAGDGSAVRLLYARYFDATSTSLQILGYQYRSANFLEFPEFISRQNRSSINGYSWEDEEWARRKRNRIEVTLNQRLGDFGSFYLGASQDSYYGTGRKTTSITGGTGTTIGSATVSLSLTKMSDVNTSDTQIGLSVSMPLGRSNTSRNLDYGSLNYSLNRNNDNRYSQSLGYSGSSLNNKVSYSANVTRSEQGKYSQSGSMGYNGNYANLNGGVSHSSGYNQYSVGASGGITLYGGGVVLSPQLGNTIAIVETTGVAGIGVGAGNTETDYFGHAVVTWLTPYRYNDISLDASRSTNSHGIELKDSSRRVVPAEGAAVLLKFATRVGRRAMVDIKSSKNIPLGAMVYTEEEEKEEAGIVGDKGLTYLSGLDARNDQLLKVIWGKQAKEQCSFTLPALPEAERSPEDWYKKREVVNCR